MNNPFPSGIVAPSERFTDREDEIAKILTEMNNPIARLLIWGRRRIGKSITDIAAYTTSDCVLLAKTAFDIAQRESSNTEKVVEKALHEIIGASRIYFERMWDDLTLSQTKLIAALLQSQSSLYKQENIDQYGLTSTASVSSIIKALEKKEIIFSEESSLTGFEFYDTFFKKWLAFKMIA